MTRKRGSRGRRAAVGLGAVVCTAVLGIATGPAAGAVGFGPRLSVPMQQSPEGIIAFSGVLTEDPPARELSEPSGWLAVDVINGQRFTLYSKIRVLPPIGVTLIACAWTPTGEASRTVHCLYRSLAGQVSLDLWVEGDGGDSTRWEFTHVLSGRRLLGGISRSGLLP